MLSSRIAGYEQGLLPSFRHVNVLDFKEPDIRKFLGLWYSLREPNQKKADDLANASPVCSADEFEMRTEIFEGACEGRIGLAPQGQGGFGYDPLFVPDGFERSFAELGEEVKNRLSHRARALTGLKSVLST